MSEYDPKQIESKWQKLWQEKAIFKAKENTDASKAYVLDMFPYPSGEGLHVGHPKGYIATDIYSRFQRMNGKNVIHPMGWDAFGLPAENFALKNKVHPRIAVEKNIKRFKEQLSIIGFDYDWDREVNTTDPKFYKWTQWIFLKLFEKGLAYESFEPINWCPSCQTGLANEDLEGGVCERCGSVVEKKPMRQWVLRITDYAERLINDLEGLDWPESIKESQRNWIGKSEGAEFEFKVTGTDTSITVFTTRADTIFGATYVVIAPEHSLIHEIEEKIENLAEVKKYIEESSKKEDMERTALGKEKSGVEIKGLRAINPVNGKEVPIYVADYVLGSYGTGAVMAVPAHDERDFEFAKKYELPVREVVVPNRVDIKNPPVPGKKSVERRNVHAIVRDPSSKKILALRWLKHPWITFPMGGVDDGEDVVEAAKREVAEETGYKNLKLIAVLGGQVRAEYFAAHKDENRVAFTTAVEFELLNHEKEDISKEEADEHEPFWFDEKDLSTVGMVHAEMDQWLLRYGKEPSSFTGEGVLLNSKINTSNTEVSFNENNEPLFTQTMGAEAVRPDLEFSEREAVTAVIKHWKDDKYLGLKWKKVDWETLVTGGVEEGQTPEEAIRAEILEETGYKNLKLVRTLPRFHSKFYHIPKEKNRFAHFHNFYFELLDDERVEVAEKEQSIHEVVWLTKEEMRDFKLADSLRYAWSTFENEKLASSYRGFDGLASEEARELVADLFGRKVVKYKLRDWVFSRQRYWGEPIPVIHCEADGVVAVPEKELPVVLPEVESYEPTGTGESPLANITDWVNTTCPKCGGEAKRETNTMPQWAGSSWYYLRYIDPHNENALVNKEKEKYWSPVDVYVGGAEHATRHLIYARFWHKFLYDIGVVNYEEPFSKLYNVGLILAEDGRKMSKRYGNVINPDDVVERFGADTLRMYEMFMGPFGQAVNWNTDGMVGVRRFIEKVWRASFTLKDDDVQELELSLHQTVRKVGEDIREFRFNTAISSLMIFFNQVERAGISKRQYLIALKLLSPFAPHVAEELWEKLDQDSLITLEKWPEYNENLLNEAKTKIAVQIDGKVRGEIEISKDSTEEEALELAKGNGAISSRLDGKEIIKVIYVPGRVLNIMVK